jgi:hypothetical protein
VVAHLKNIARELSAADPTGPQPEIAVLDLSSMATESLEIESFATAAVTIAGIELAHRIRKRQFSLGRGRYRNFGSLKQIWERALA